MNYSIIRYILGQTVSVVSVLMLLPALVGALYTEKSAWSFLLCAVLFFILGRIMSYKKPKNKVFYAKEGFVAVSLCWIVLSIMSAVPFVLSNSVPSVIDALFEIVSGYTTTGSSILSDVEALPRCMLFWRSFSHWLGGMGVLVFVLAILPSADGQNMYFMRAESPGPDVGKLMPNLRKTATVLYMIYTGMTLLQFMLLFFSNMPIFDAICITFGTAGTGGFSVLNSGCASYTIFQQAVITVFMVLFGINFNFYFYLLCRKWQYATKMSEVKTYIAIYLSATAMVCIQLWRIGDPSPIINGAFQTASIMTTTGYTTTDFNLWPVFSKVILVGLMFIGACAGSTGGGIKVSRIMIYAKAMKREMAQLLHPRRVKVLTMDGKVIDGAIVRTALIFLVAYFFIFSGSVLIVSLDCKDFETAFTSVAATLNNIGPGLGGVGPMSNFGGFSVLSKCVFIFDMLAGRLEIFPLLLTLRPLKWKS